ncbi:Erythroid differentiation-related factor 1 [Seminavis robusta]|uniref:Erythroid differentiation-related factor 1 n=1 Tax=Seminavis robusta TaxID=568900 RepID=A0A9N8D7U1_9STRA|nr:Erythroid differentiation-related factor 1 [Seminavis robusta]|eukprot:Sro30_g019460.1 Erythroid differentiation-related factor 1 (1329) ;mRNA; f:32221-36207
MKESTSTEETATPKGDDGLHPSPHSKPTPEGTITTTTPTTTTTATTSAETLLMDGSSASAAGNSEGNNGALLDYVGTKQSVLKLFSLPFSNQSVSVGIHNVEGCLLIDADPALTNATAREPSYNQEKIGEEQQERKHKDETMVLPVTNQQHSAALAVISSIIEKGDTATSTAPADHGTKNMPHPALDKAVELFEKQKSSSEPTEYYPWEFSGMKMLVGSDAIVYRSATPETSLTVRVEDAEVMRQQLEMFHHHQSKDQNEKNAQQQQHPGKRTYAEALRTRKLMVDQQNSNKPGGPSNNQSQLGPSQGCSAPPDQSNGDTYASFQLQTTVLPSTNMPLAEKFSISSEPPTTSDGTSALSSPICTCIDAYLDQLIANVPQLALVLREHGFVQSVKLLQTEHISALMNKETYDTSNPFEVINLHQSSNSNSSSTPTSTAPASPSDPDHLFDPKVLKMNATSLLNFLKANCTKDNATYLLHREAGQSNIQLLDITSSSQQRQKKWIWVLAMMSYRFSQRLRHLSSDAIMTDALKRSFRSRERSLLQNTLSLLEDFADMGGQPHELLVAEVCQKLAGTFLRARASMEDASLGGQQKQQQSDPSQPCPAISKALHPKFSAVKPDSLSKALDYLERGTAALWQLWRQTVATKKKQTADDSSSTDLQNTVVSIEADSSSSDEEEEEEAKLESEVKGEALAFQLMPLHDETIDIALRLAEHHMGAYWSSSAMQSLRKAARTMADAIEVCQFAKNGDKGNQLSMWKHRLQLQYTRLWELCGHFARSFAADDLWRERGHAAGDDVVSVLRDAEAALPLQRNQPVSPRTASRAEYLFAPYQAGLLEEAGDLFELSGLVDDGEPDALEAARELLDMKRQLGRDRRRVLVAACISYRRAVAAYEASLEYEIRQGGNGRDQSGSGSAETSFHTQLVPEEAALLILLFQRLGDAYNELGKLFLQELRQLLSAGHTTDHGHEAGAARKFDKPAAPLLASAQHCFEAGVRVFQKSGDTRNACLLLCNICQCYKLRANATFAGRKGDKAPAVSHADTNLKCAIQQLEAAHEMMGQRDADPFTWDMVSNELAATLLVLGVRRRQALLGGGSVPTLLHILRLSPGETRSIVEPMEKALLIYEQSGNFHQTAAVQYQLAQFFSKVWTCQRDEAQTREKLSLAFKHYNSAHGFFSRSLRGNEATFVLLCLDLSNLYSTVSGEAGEECHCQALKCYIDTMDAFSTESIEQRGRTVEAQAEWISTMATLATSVEDRLFKTLRCLVKLEESKAANTDVSGGCSYKSIYRAALGVKMGQTKRSEAEKQEASPLLNVHDILRTVNEQYVAKPRAS